MSFDSGLMPMTEAELEHLDALLSGPGCADDGMSLEMLDGFFSALIVGPELVMPSEYLPYVWGDRSPWPDPDAAAEAVSAVMRLWNHIAWRVQQPVVEGGDAEAQAVLMPSLALPEQGQVSADADDPLAGVPVDFPFAAGWAHGFLLGVSLRGQAWGALIEGDELMVDDMSMVVSLSALDATHAAELDLPTDRLMDLHDRLAAVMELPAMLHELNQARLQGHVRQPIRREPVPGRNAACPCGSGKKFKKCCGGAGRLH